MLPTLAPTMNCGPGQYISGTMCVDCNTPGRYAYTLSPPWATSCDLCKSGRYSQGPDATTGAYSSCLPCPVGKLSSPDRTLCTDCVAGQYAFNASECVDCEVGRYAPQALEGECFLCEAGSHTTAVAKATSCVACSSGLFSVGGQMSCTTCPAGSFSSFRAPTCSLCSPGSAAPSDGASSCVLCSAGQYQAGQGALTCATCSPGKYQGSTSQESCVPCLAGTYSNEEAASSCNYCTGSFFSDEGATACTSCLQGYYFSLAGTCEECPDGTSCETSGSALQEMLTINPGFWRISAQSVSIYECPLKNSCAGGDNFTRNGDGYCLVGFMGPLCAVCDPSGYYFNPDQRSCVECGELKNPITMWLHSPTLIIFTVLLVLAIAAATSVCCASSTAKANERMALVAGVQDKIEGMSVVQQVVSTIRARLPGVKHSKVKLKCFVSFSQIVATVGFTCNVSFPSIFETIISPLALMNLNIVPALGLQCRFNGFDYVDTMILITVAPLVMASLIGLAYILQLLATRNKPTRLSSEKFFYAFLLLTYLVLINTSVSLFEFFQCQEFAEIEPAQSYLVRDFSVDCENDRYVSAAIYAVCMIFVYPVGIPLMYFCLLHGNRHTLSDEDAMKAEAEMDYPTVGHILFLVEAYRPEHYTFEALECGRRLLLASVIGVLDSESAASPTLGILLCFCFNHIFETWR